MTAPRECRPPEGPYTENVIPMGDASMRTFIEELAKVSPYSPAAVRKAVHQCWRDIHNTPIAEPPHG